LNPRTPIVQPYSSRYTNWAMTVLKMWLEAEKVTCFESCKYKFNICYTEYKGNWFQLIEYGHIMLWSKLCNIFMSLSNKLEKYQYSLKDIQDLKTQDFFSHKKHLPFLMSFWRNWEVVLVSSLHIIQHSAICTLIN